MASLKAVAFDIIETVFSLETMRSRFKLLGLPSLVLDVWFARALRDAFALAAAGGYAPFKDVQAGALHETLMEHGIQPSDDVVDAILDGMAELEAHPDAATAFREVRDAGCSVIALSNGSAATTSRLLDRAGLSQFVSYVLSVEGVRRSKPVRDVYLEAAARAGGRPEELALVAAHPWDLNGAAAAGLITAFVARGRPYPAYMTPADVSGTSLSSAVSELLALSLPTKRI